GVTLGDSASIRSWRLRRNWYLPVGSALLGVLLAFVLMTSNQFGWEGAIFGGFFAMLFWARNAFPLSTPVSLEVTKSDLIVDGWSIAASDIVEARMIPQPTRHATHVAELVLRDRRTISLATSLVDGMALFDLLGIRPGERRASFTTVVPFGKRFL